MPMESHRGKDHLSPTSQSPMSWSKGPYFPDSNSSISALQLWNLTMRRQKLLGALEFGRLKPARFKSHAFMGKAKRSVASRRDCKKREVWHLRGICRVLMGSVQQVQEVRFLDLQKALTLQSPTKARSQITPTFKVGSGVWTFMDFPSFQCLERFASSNLLVFSFCLFWSALIFCLRTWQSQKIHVSWESACIIQIPCLQMSAMPFITWLFLWNPVELSVVAAQEAWKHHAFSFPSVPQSTLQALWTLASDHVLRDIEGVGTSEFNQHDDRYDWLLPPKSVQPEALSTVASSLVSQHTCAFKILLVSSNCKETLMYLAKISWCWLCQLTSSVFEWNLR